MWERQAKVGETWSFSAFALYIVHDLSVYHAFLLLFQSTLPSLGARNHIHCHGKRRSREFSTNIKNINVCCMVLFFGVILSTILVWCIVVWWLHSFWCWWQRRWCGNCGMGSWCLYFEKRTKNRLLENLCTHAFTITHMCIEFENEGGTFTRSLAYKWMCASVYARGDTHKRERFRQKVIARKTPS